MSTTRKIKAQSIDGVAFSLNYLENATANDKVTYWNRFLDAVATRPADGTGGSPSANVTWTRSTSSPLQGEASFLYSKLNTASTQGEGVSYDFTIPNGQQARVQSISFDYQIASGTYSGGTSSTDSDLIVYIYRTTATGRLIEPSVIKLDGAVVDVNYSYRGEFQTDSDATGYRFIIYSATTSTSNFTVKFDNFYVGPSKNVTGAIATEWNSYTLTIGATTTAPTPGATTINAAYWRRVGSSMQIRYDISAAAGSAGSGTYLFPLPSGYTIDSTKATVSTNSNNALSGAASSFSSFAGEQNMSGYAVAYNTTNLAIVTGNDLNAVAFVSNTRNSAANGVRYSFSTEVPIVGWGATATLGQDADTRVVAMRAQAAVPTGPTDGSGPVVFGTAAIFDTHAGYSTSTGRYTVPVGGYYKVKAQINLTGTEASNQFVIFGVYKNATVQQSTTSRIQSTALDDTCHPFDCTVFANAGDLLDVRVNTNITAVAYNSNANNNFIEITRMSGPSQIAASEVVAARAGLTTSQTAVTNKILPFNSVTINTHGSLNSSNGIFTAPQAGIYRVSASAYLYALDGTTNARLQIRKNSTAVTDVIMSRAAGGSTAESGACVSDLVSCVAGDTIDIFVIGDASFDIDSSASRTFVAIDKVG